MEFGNPGLLNVRRGVLVMGPLDQEDQGERRAGGQKGIGQSGLDVADLAVLLAMGIGRTGLGFVMSALSALSGGNMGTFGSKGGQPGMIVQARKCGQGGSREIKSQQENRQGFPTNAGSCLLSNGLHFFDSISLTAYYPVS